MQKLRLEMLSTPLTEEDRKDHTLDDLNREIDDPN